MPAPSFPKIIGHRGDAIHCPENTWESFRSALSYPIDGIEFDVQLTKDLVPVVFHDRTLKRMTGSTKTIHESTWDDLKDIDIGSWFSSEFADQRIARLDDVFSQFAGRTDLLVELKLRGPKRWQIELAKVLAKTTSQQVHVSQIYLLCYDLNLLKEMHHICSDLQLVWNQDHAELTEHDDFLTAYSVNINGLDMAFAESIRVRQKLLFTFTCNQLADVHTAVAMGANAIMSDRPGWLADRINHLRTNNS